MAEWYLLTNVPESVPCSQLALWYCWRWQIESFFKLLKTQGFGLENWQQATGDAVAKRLAVVCCACVTVWEIMQSTEAEPLKMLLVRLSGRQMKHGVKVTDSAVLVGLWQFYLPWNCSGRINLSNYMKWPKCSLSTCSIGIKKMCRYLCPMGEGWGEG
ncbi:MAG: transposase [Moraxellaceae bacterium]|nr:transposase [Moraxellaceae bacterium]